LGNEGDNLLVQIDDRRKGKCCEFVEKITPGERKREHTKNHLMYGAN